LADKICDLDIFTRDELATRFDPARVETLLGFLVSLRKVAAELADKMQKNGRPRDVTEERWILELADIYENAFRERAAIWGSGNEPVARRGRFYRFLELNRPESFPRNGKLGVSQIHRILKRRKGQRRTVVASGNIRRASGHGPGPSPAQLGHELSQPPQAPAPQVQANRYRVAGTPRTRSK
jgi:hypothetical protein